MDRQSAVAFRRIVGCLFFLHNWAAAISPAIFNRTPPHFYEPPYALRFVYKIEKRPVRRPESLRTGRE
ncbi:hypothetical protein [Paenibacillus illinoisensis]|uniref:hypothetical protein n=1 Tax=Paenibacillus illinoisensis TaxID=59845 RepID=UPI00301CEC5E